MSSAAVVIGVGHTHTALACESPVHGDNATCSFSHHFLFTHLLVRLERRKQGMAPLWGNVLCRLVLVLVMGIPGVLLIDIRMDSAVYGIVGESVKLWCGFYSTVPASKFVAVDWRYRPADGGPAVTIMHYQSKAYPILDGPFKDRITWEGDVGGGDVSIRLDDLRLTDNGTLSCVVRNPPDVHGKVPEMKLTVTLQSISFKFNTVLLLSALVLIPSALVSIILLVRMKRAIKSQRFKSKMLKKSPIEASQDCVYDDGVTVPLHHTSTSGKPPGCLMRLCMRCADESDDY
ncbi:PREDICTED: myelin protein zero-like protein 3 [Nanorana parkeri]|uniref:myelin protein zero-like protein 3 n=1 Tax=Nanorana parkeri TaxID=125878 RepID=UPI0008541F0C|nr:PREDICTED: myelin protein zero-like protein 3 [Nanorana parkeri]